MKYFLTERIGFDKSLVKRTTTRITTTTNSILRPLPQYLLAVKKQLLKKEYVLRTFSHLFPGHWWSDKRINTSFERSWLLEKRTKKMVGPSMHLWNAQLRHKRPRHRAQIHLVCPTPKFHILQREKVQKNHTVNRVTH